MGIFTQAYNKIQYELSKVLNDPDAKAYAEEQAAQAKQDAEAKKREDDEMAKAEKDAITSEKAQEDAQNLNERSQFKPTRAIGKITSGTVSNISSIIFYLLIIILMLFAGHIAANEAIGYNAPFRILSFFYGALCFWYVVPRALIQKYYYKMKLPYYGLLPVSKYTPGGNELFNYLFSYKENPVIPAEQQKVEALYESGYLRSIGKISEATGLIASANSAIVAAKAALSNKAIANQQSHEGNQSHKEINNPQDSHTRGV